jgi:glutamate N-acetyltransferase/amino-acid N-acetyltransferase
VKKISVPGFRFSGVATGVKKRGVKDLALIASDQPATAAAVFTTNRVVAAPVILGRERIQSGRIQAAVINSGNANVGQGKRGIQDAEEMCERTAKCLGIHPQLVFPSSTGVIGVPLMMDKIRRGIDRAAHCLTSDGLWSAAEAILTTDLVAKVSTRTSDPTCWTVAGITKGAGMIAPHMATMLAYIMTDAAVEPWFLQEILHEGLEESFNSITVDGDMSTNDTVLLLANGVSGNSPIRRKSNQAKDLKRAFHEVMKELAVMIVKDGEGATKVVEIQVKGARSKNEARRVAWKVANSNLVKTAFFGEDANFGRILGAVGAAGVSVNPDTIDISFDHVPVVRKGIGVGILHEDEAHAVLKKPAFSVRVDLNLGRAEASVWTSDLSLEYVKINASYRS